MRARFFTSKSNPASKASPLPITPLLFFATFLILLLIISSTAQALVAGIVQGDIVELTAGPF